MDKGARVAKLLRVLPPVLFPQQIGIHPLVARLAEIARNHRCQGNPTEIGGANPFDFVQGVDMTGLRVRLVDGEGQVLGRLASRLAHILQGKDKPTFCPNKDEGDVVVVVNAQDIEVTGRKLKNKMYRWHTGYPGGLRERTLERQLEVKPEEVLMKAVERMLPDNRLRKHRMRKLRMFMGPDHPFDEDVLTPFEMPPRNLSKKENVEIPEGFEPMNRDAWEKRYLRWGKDSELAKDIKSIRGERKS